MLDIALDKPQDAPLANQDLPPHSRIHRLRQRYWDRTYFSFVHHQPMAGCGSDSLTGHGQDFAALLRASDPQIQPDELIVGSSLVRPEAVSSSSLIDLGYYNPHYPPGYTNLLRHGLAGMRDLARSGLESAGDAASEDFYRAVALSYDAACATWPGTPPLHGTAPGSRPRHTGVMTSCASQRCATSWRSARPRPFTPPCSSSSSCACLGGGAASGALTSGSIPFTGRTSERGG